MQARRTRGERDAHSTAQDGSRNYDTYGGLIQGGRPRITASPSTYDKETKMGQMEHEMINDLWSSKGLSVSLIAVLAGAILLTLSEKGSAQEPVSANKAPVTIQTSHVPTENKMLEPTVETQKNRCCTAATQAAGAQYSGIALASGQRTPALTAERAPGSLVKGRCGCTPGACANRLGANSSVPLTDRNIASPRASNEKCPCGEPGCTCTYAWQCSSVAFPSTTPLGLAVLVLLVAGTALWVMRRGGMRHVN